MKKSLQRLTKQRNPREIFEQIINLKSLPRGSKEPIKTYRRESDVFISPLKKKRELTFAQKIKRDGREKKAAVNNEPIKDNYYDDCILNIPWISLGPTVYRSNLSLQDIDIDDEKKKLHCNDIRNKGKFKQQPKDGSTQKKDGVTDAAKPPRKDLEVIEDTNYQFLRSSKKKRCKFYSTRKIVKSNNNKKKKNRKNSNVGRKSSIVSDISDDYDGILPKLIFENKNENKNEETKDETTERKRLSSFCLPSIVISVDSGEETEEEEEEEDNNNEEVHGRSRTFSFPHGQYSRRRRGSSITLFPHAFLSTASAVAMKNANSGTLDSKKNNGNEAFPRIPLNVKKFDGKNMTNKQMPAVTASDEYKRILTSIGD